VISQVPKDKSLTGQNVVVTLSATHGITLLLSILEPYSEAITGDAPPILDPGHLKYASKYMNKLSLEPPFAQTITSIFVQLNQSAPSRQYSQPDIVA
jgi:hypothetical protein